jgi:dihydropyrimidine dehydrogenase (NAD+) subunit PreA
MSDNLLKTSFASLELVNPFLIGSGPPTRNGEMIRRALEAGWGGVVTKTVYEGTMPPEKYALALRPLLAGLWYRGRMIGVENFAQSGDLTVADWQSEIPGIKAQFPERIVIASIIADMRREAWQQAARGMQDAGADAIELNLSCPHGADDVKTGGTMVGENPDFASQVTSWTTSVVQVPVIVKLPGTLSSLETVASQCLAAGAAGFATINTVPCIIGVNLDTFEPQPSSMGRSAYGGYSGPAIKPIAMAATAEIARTGAPAVSGVGGIETWQDAAEFILLGAHSVQLCTAVMLRGYGIVTAIKRGLEKYLDNKGLTSIDQIRGAALQRMGENVHSLEKDHDLVARILENCNGCGLCVISCRDGGHSAITILDNLAVVDESRCVGCALCGMVCPSKSIVMTAGRGQMGV